jgi:hypothetical protein
MGAGEYDDPDCPEARAGLDEADPQEEVGGEGCESEAEKCEFRAGSLDGQAQESEFSIMDELHEQMRVDPIQVVADPIDGLPHPITKDAHFSPPFTYENVVCLEDCRSYVEVFADELPEAGWYPADDVIGVRSVSDFYEYEKRVEAERDLPEHDRDPQKEVGIEVTHACFDAGPKMTLIVRCKYNEAGEERQRLRFDGSEAEQLYGLSVVLPDGERGAAAIPVRPIRERCRHYKRQCMGNDDQPDPTAFLHYIRFRNCTVRRSIGGAFLSLRDEAIYACDYRDPPDPVSVEKHLDGPDRRKLVGRPDLVKVPLFGLEGDVLNQKEGSGK